jgi:hypothetical protein
VITKCANPTYPSTIPSESGISTYESTVQSQTSNLETLPGNQQQEAPGVVETFSEITGTSIGSFLPIIVIVAVIGTIFIAIKIFAGGV